MFHHVSSRHRGDGHSEGTGRVGVTMPISPANIASFNDLLSLQIVHSKGIMSMIVGITNKQTLHAPIKPNLAFSKNLRANSTQYV